MTSASLDRIFQRLLIVLFFIFISVPPVKMIVQDTSLFSVAEKRTLATFPLLPEDFSQLQNYFSGLDNYLDDHFGFREWMIYRYQREVRKRFEDASNITEVIRGADNWYFYTGNEMLEDFTGRNLRSDAELGDWIQSYRDKKAWLENRGIRYLLVIPPNKTTIYTQFVGEPWASNRGMTRLTQLKNRLSDTDKSTLVDLSPALLQMNHLDTLYFKSDTHWTPYGAFLAYLVIAEKIESMFHDVRLKRDFPISSVLKRTCDKKDSPCGGLTNMLLDYESFTENYRTLETFPQCAEKVGFDFKLSNLPEGHKELYFHTVCEKAALKAVVFRDSFFRDLEPYISENFHEVIYLWKDYDQANIEELLSKFKPDIVIEEKVERLL